MKNELDNILANDASLSLENKLLAGVDAILGKDGALMRYGLSYQKQQHEYARAVAIGLARGKDDMCSMTLLEAATGTGKTIGYGVPLALWVALTGNRAAVSTYTLHLQRQILDSDMPKIFAMVKEQTGCDLAVARRIGVKNFVSYSQLLAVASDIEREPGDQDQWDSLQTFIRFAKDSTSRHIAAEYTSARGAYCSGEIAQFMEDNDLHDLPFGLTQDQVCVSSDSPEAELYSYRRHCDDAKLADIVITSHAMTIVHTRAAFSILDEDKPISALVVDEADKFVEVAESMLTQSFPVTRVRALLEKIEHPAFVSCAKAAKKLEGSLKTCRDEKSGQRVIVAPDNPKLDKAIVEFADALNAAIKLITAQAKKSKQSDGQLAMALPLARPADLSLSARTSLARPTGLPQELIKLGRVDKEYFAELVGYNKRLRMLVADFIGGDKNKKYQNVVPAISFSPCKSFPSLSLIPTNPGYMLAKLWTPRDLGDDESLYLKACLMTSATLGDPYFDKDKRFNKFACECGIFARKNIGNKDAPEHKQVLQINEDLFDSFEPRKFGKIEFFLADPSLPKPLIKDDEIDEEHSDTYSNTKPHPEWLAYVANTICFARLTGNTLVLTNSYRDADALARLLSALPIESRPHHVFEHKRGMKLRGLIEQFKGEPNSVLISPCAWEGVSISDNVVRNLLITRLPYGGRDMAKIGVWTSTLLRAGKSLTEVQGIQHAAYASAARRKMKQGLGRAIRDANDQCRIFITDPRFPAHDSLAFKEQFGASRSTNSTFHHCVPKRFRPALEQAKILRKDGNLFDLQR